MFRVRRKFLCLTVCLLPILFLVILPVQCYSARVPFDLKNRFELLITSLEFNLHIVMDASITDLPAHVDRGEHHTMKVEADFVSGNTFGVNELKLDIDPLLLGFGTEYHLEDYAEYGLPVLVAILAAAGVSLPAAGIVELARQILTHTDIVIYLDIAGEITVSGPAAVDRDKLAFRNSRTQEFILSINETASHNQLVTVSNRFSLDSKFRFDLDKAKVPDWVYNTLNVLLGLPWEVSLGSDYGDVNLETTTVVFDSTPPLVTIVKPPRAAVFFSRTIDVSWQGTDDYSIGYYKLRLDEEEWPDVSLQTSHTFQDLSPGRHMVEVQGVDEAGNAQAASVTFYIRQEAGPWPALGDFFLGIPVVKDMVLVLDDFVPGYGSILFLLIVAVLVVGVVYALKRWFEW